MKNVLYLGDTALDRGASYLAGVMRYYGIGYDYANSDTKFSNNWLRRDYGLVILSDYPACNFSADQFKALADMVKNGCGLLMIGGWESFTGDGGDYKDTLLSKVLPVKMKDCDDRVNFSSTSLIIKENDHEIVNGLDFNSSVTAVGGLNEVETKETAVQVLSAVEYKVVNNDGEVEFNPVRKYPLLVTDDYGRGRVGAFTSDVAPHWVGPLVDWGLERVKAKADGGEPIEVGSDYARFFASLIKWLCAE